MLLFCRFFLVFVFCQKWDADCWTQSNNFIRSSGVHFTAEKHMTPFDSHRFDLTKNFVVKRFLYFRH